MGLQPPRRAAPMEQQWRCPQGHEWPSRGGKMKKAVCPVCGAQASSLTTSANPAAAAQGTQAVAGSGPPHASPPAAVQADTLAGGSDLLRVEKRPPSASS